MGVTTRDIAVAKKTDRDRSNSRREVNILKPIPALQMFFGIAFLYFSAMFGIVIVTNRDLVPETYFYLGLGAFACLFISIGIFIFAPRH